MNFGQTSFLEQYDSAPDAEKFPLIRRWIDSMPLPFFEELRAKRPILATPICTLVARFDDVVEILRLSTVFTAELYVPKMGDYMLAQDDTPTHTREKGIMRTMLNRDDVPKVRKFIAERARESLDVCGQQIELVNQYGRAIPTALVQEYFGLDGVDPKTLIEWSYWNQYDTFHNQPFDIVSDSEALRHKSEAVGQEMIEYLGQLIPRRLAEIQAGNKRDDIVSRMLLTSYPESVGFTMARLVRNVGGLLIGAVETTSQAVTQIVQELLRRPEILHHASAIAQTSDDYAFDSIVWEALRFNPITA